MSHPAHRRYFYIIAFYFVLTLTCSIAISAKAQSPQCSLSVPATEDFGRFPANVGNPSTTPPQINSNISVSCSDLPANKTLAYCVTLTPQINPPYSYNNRFLFNGSDSWHIVYFYDNDGKDWGNPQIGNSYPPLGLAGFAAAALVNNKGIEQPFHMQLNPFTAGGAPDRTGLYQNIFIADLYYNFSNANISDPQQLCAKTVPQGTQSSLNHRMTVKATSERTCMFRTIKSIQFQANFSPDNVPPETGEIGVFCTSGLTYKVGLSAGDNGQDGKRAMRCQTSLTCGNSLIYYDIYKDTNFSSAGVWGNDWNDPDSIVTYTSHGWFEYYHPAVRIYKGQNAPAGSYRDSVIITLRPD